MKINDSNSSYNSLYEATQSQKKATQVANSKTENNEVVYEKGNQQEDNTIKSDYSHLKSTKYVVDKSEIESMKAELDEKVQQSFIQMAKSVMGDQYVGYRDAIESIIMDKENTATPEMIEQAKIDVSEGGYWSAENTSDRILNLAKALSGGNPEKSDMLKEAFLAGFEKAEESWGGSLPEICQETKEAVLQGFEDWENEIES